MISITEILKNPVGKENEIPGGESHEFIELFNIGSDTLFIENLFITDGIEVDSIIPWYRKIEHHRNCCFNRNYLLPEQFAVILDRDYEKAQKNSCFRIQDSTVILTVNASNITGGL
ncbi:MAG: hypothetical protein PVI26_10920, partial [Chitinispirillia bacterium]